MRATSSPLLLLLFMSDSSCLLLGHRNTGCWTESAAVMAWAKRKGYMPMQILGYFQSRIQRIVHSQGKQTMFCERSHTARHNLKFTGLTQNMGQL